MKTLASLIVAAPILAALCSPVFAENSDYSLNPGDVLQITVWKEDGLDREVLVLPDGSISFPLIGVINVRGQTATQVQSLIKAKLARDVPDASVSVSVKAALGHAVSVIGQVAKPGELIAAHRITVMQALSMAGGLTPFAATGDIIVLRHVDGQDVAIAFPYDDVIRGRALDKDIALTPGDVIVVPTAGLF